MPEETSLFALTAKVQDLQGSVTNLVSSTNSLAIVANKLTRHMDRLLATVEVMAKTQEAITTKLCEIERKVYKLPDNVSALRQDG